MENKTAVEIFCTEIMPMIHESNYFELSQLYQKALAIEQKQIEDAYHNAQIELFKESVVPILSRHQSKSRVNDELENILSDREDAEQYYSQTFKSKENDN